MARVAETSPHPPRIAWRRDDRGLGVFLGAEGDLTGAVSLHNGFHEVTKYTDKL